MLNVPLQERFVDVQPKYTIEPDLNDQVQKIRGDETIY